MILLILGTTALVLAYSLYGLPQPPTYKEPERPDPKQEMIQHVYDLLRTRQYTRARSAINESHYALEDLPTSSWVLMLQDHKDRLSEDLASLPAIVSLECLLESHRRR